MSIIKKNNKQQLKAREKSPVKQKVTAPKLIHHFLERSADFFPKRQAVFHSGNKYTYDFINKQANRLARLLLKSGVAKGDRVGFLIENSVEYIITYYAILKTGAITTALNTESIESDIAFVLKDCGIKVLLTSKNQLIKTKALLEQKTSLKHLLIWAERKNPDPSFTDNMISFLPEALSPFPDTNPSVNIADSDTASIVYTSGTTAQPLGVVLSHLNIVANTRSIIQYLHLSKKDRVMAVLPFYYIYGKSLLNTHFYAGGSVVIDNRFLYPNVILKTMQEQKVTGFSGVPSTFGILLNRSNVKDLSFKYLRYLTQAGGALAPALQKEVAKVFSPAKLYIMYGATEASARLSYLDPKDLPRKWGSIGKAIPGVELFVADNHGKRLQTGEPGELAARGKNIMKGYWNRPEETKKVLRNGLYYTGDIGVMDKEGFLFIEGRKKDIIKAGGNRVSSKEIEHAFYEHHSIAEAAVIGVKDKVMGEEIKAFVVLKEGYKEAGQTKILKNFLKKHLAPYKIPKYIEYLNSLPKNKSGKIQKRILLSE